MVASTEFASFLCDQLAPLGHVTVRRMFGKTGVFCEGVMFGMVTENILYLRVDDQNSHFEDLRQAWCWKPCPGDHEGHSGRPDLRGQQRHGGHCRIDMPAGRGGIIRSAEWG